MQPDAAQMPGEVLSPSQASTFLGCSAKYRFKYVLDLPDPASGGAARGRAVHKAIEHYMRAKIAGLQLDGEAITDEWDEIWDEATEGAEFAARENVEALKASGRQLAGKYLREAAPRIQPLAVEIPVSGEISGDHAFQLATYATLLDLSVSGETRIDSLVSTKDPQLVQIEHTPGKSGSKLVENMYPLVAEGIANGLFLPNRASTLCPYCPYARACEAEYGGVIDRSKRAAGAQPVSHRR
jgi:CRISPR/Cas system-associated exonuclease Cas4 (RecB family)